MLAASIPTVISIPVAVVTSVPFLIALALAGAGLAAWKLRGRA